MRKLYFVLIIVILTITNQLVAQPTITNFSPASGPVGTTVIITGTNFNSTPANNVVFFGATMANVSLASTTSLTVTVPSGANYQTISVTDVTSGLSAYSAHAFTVSFLCGGPITTNSFMAKVDYTTGTQPAFVAMGDLDGDGKPDLVVGNTGSAFISIFRNTGSNGTISFASKIDSIAGNGIYSVAIGDIDGDGKSDLAAANYDDNTISVFRNTSFIGNILFDSKVNFLTGNGPHGIDLADLDNDGKPELVTANAINNTASVLKNSSSVGIISFAAKMDFTTGGYPQSIVAGDVDEDGKADLVIANYNDNTISVLQNTTSGGAISFAAKSDFATGLGPKKVILADIDGDSKQDVATANYNNPSTISALRNISTIGTVSFEAKIDFTTGGGPFSIAAGDLNGDGKLDLATASAGTNTVSLFENLSTSGTISFATKVDYVAGSFAYYIDLGDLDSDGRPDLAMINYLDNTVSIFRNQIYVAPVMTSSNAVTICSGDSVNISLTSNIPSTYTWQATDNLFTTGESTPLQASGTLKNTLINNSSSVQTVTYSVIPSSIIGNCVGATQTVTVTINPAPAMSSASSMSVCSGYQFSVVFTSTLPSSYTWFATDNVNTTGETTTNQTTTAISDIITNNTLSDQAVTYSITPISISSSCVGNSQTFIATVNPLPISKAGVDTTICSGTAASIGDLMVAGNTYSWNPGTGLSDATVSNPDNITINSSTTPIVTTYTVTTTITASGCHSVDSSVITVNPQPVLIITDPAAVCFPNTLDLTAGSITAGSTGGGTYSYWTDAGVSSSLSLPNAVVASETNYIKVTAVGGCTDIQPVITTVNPLPISNAGIDTTVCSGIAASIGDLGIIGNTYSWNPSLGLSDATISNPGNTTTNGGSTPIVTTYTVTATITATGCQSVDSAIVTVNPQPVLTITDPAAVCFPNTLDLTGGAVTLGSTGGGTYSYWTNAGASNSLSSPNAVAASETNYIKVTAIGGCTDIAPVMTIINPLPISNAGIDTTICSGMSASIGDLAVAGNTYSWNPSTGLSSATVSNPDNTTINSGITPIVTTYNLTTTITSTGCQSMDSSVITVNPQPVLTITNPAAECFPNTVDLTAGSVSVGSIGGGILSYWTDAGASNSLASPDVIATSGTNYVKVTATGGCIDIQPVTAIINPLPIVDFSGLDSNYCLNFSAQTLTGTPMNGIFSGNGINSNVFSPSEAGSGTHAITYTFTDGNSCTNAAAHSTEILPLPIAPPICMVTVDSSSINNIIYWDKTSYSNVDSFIVYRETTNTIYKRVGAVPYDSMSLFIDTVRQLYFPNTGNPNVGTYRYKLQIRDTCGNYGVLGLYHKTIYVNQTGGTFTFNDYSIESQPAPLPELSAYVLLRDDNSNENWQILSSNTSSPMNDPDYASFPNARWRVETQWSINCSPTRVISTTRSNIKGLTVGVSNLGEFANAVTIYPNPYSINTTISYVLNKKSDVNIEVYTSIGQKVETLVNAKQSMGEYKYNFSSKEKEYNAGVYFVKISIDGKATMRRIVEVE